MSFDLLETSARRGKPVYLFRFVAGTVVYNYTNVDIPFTYLSETYMPIAGLKPSATGQSHENNSQRITITANKDWLIPRLFVSFVPAIQIFLAIFVFHRDDPTDVHTFWQGFIRDAKWIGQQSSVECDPISVALDRPGLRRTFQAVCNNVLYDGFCPVPASAFRVDGALSAPPAGFIVQASAWASKPDQWFKAGFIERPLLSGTLDLRFIISHVGDTLTLLSPYPQDLASGETLRAYAGCDLTFTTCAGKFGAYTDTGGAFAGWDRVPQKNLFKTGVNNAF
jgi:uncharacterized phage protein (TIGR02218 family)